MTSEEQSSEEQQVEPPRAPLESRDASLGDVNYAQRLIEVIAAPYEEEAIVEYRGEIWREYFERGAWDGIEKRPNRVKANRDHDSKRVVGKAVNFWPSREEGLVAEVRIAKTDLGDETLALADEQVLDASVFFGVRGSDQELDRPYRRIKRAFMGHLAFVAEPAYQGAKVLAVRSGDPPVSASELPPLDTPNLDEVAAWLKTRRDAS